MYLQIKIFKNIEIKHKINIILIVEKKYNLLFSQINHISNIK